jgi:hypothetical protein
MVIDIAALFRNGYIADIVLAVMLLEAVVLLAWRGAVNARAVLALLLPGACLVFALRAALTGAHWTWIAVALTLAFVAHVADIRQRFIRRTL